MDNNALKNYFKYMTQETLDNDANDIKIMLNQKHNKINGDGFIVNYYENDDKICLVKMGNNSETLTHTFKKKTFDKSILNNNKYFENKGIFINTFNNIELLYNNFKIPLFNTDFKKVAEQRIYYDYKTLTFKKCFENSPKDNFYFFGSKNATKSIFCEGVADALLFYQNLKNKDDVCIICPMADNNMLNVFNKLNDINNNITHIYYLVDNDENNVGIDKANLILNENKKYKIMLIKSNENNIKDFCDIYKSNKKHLNSILDNVIDFNNDKIFIDYNNLNDLKLIIDNNINSFNNTLIKIIINKFTLSKSIKIDDNDKQQIKEIFVKISDFLEFYDFDYDNIINKITQYLLIKINM